MELKVNVNDVPLEALILIAASKRDVSVTLSNETCLTVKDKVQFKSNVSAMRYLANTDDNIKWMGSSALERCETNHWITYAVGPLSNKECFEEALNYLDKVIAPVTYLVGSSCSLADVVVWCKLFNSRKWIDTVLSDGSPTNITRWYSFIGSLDYVKNAVTQLDTLNTEGAPTNLARWYSHMANLPFVKEALTQISTLTNNFPIQIEKNKVNTVAPLDSTGRKEEGKFVDLPGAEMGKVVVRFPPEASGYLHIGHAKAALLNQYYKDAFNGELIMRFDDTNPAKEKEDYEKVILEDLKLLNIKYDKLTRTSSYFDIMLDMCEKLIRDNKAYVDDTNAEEMKQEREKKICSKNRDNSVEKNLAMWEEMKKGTEKGQLCCVRAKIDMASLNGCMRDPTIYRCKTELHPQTGDKYKVYPTYDFACPIVDSLEGVTHCLRTMEYHDRDEQFYWFIEALNLRKPYIWEYSRLNMTNTVLSKRKLTWFVDNGYVNGWDDPRMPTVRGVLRRGMTVEGLKQFIIAQGSSRSVVLMEWDKIWAINKKVIDPVVPRYTAVEALKNVPVTILNITETSMNVAKHPKNSDVGEKTMWIAPRLLVDEADAVEFKEGENVTFINWGNIKIKEIKKDADNKIIEVIGVPNIEDKNYKKTLKITWLAETKKAPLIPVTCLYFDHIISKAILGKDEDFKQYINHQTMFKVQMIGEPILASIKKSEIIQLQRKGYFICDQAYEPHSIHSFTVNPVVLIYIPEGTSKGLPPSVLATAQTNRNLDIKKVDTSELVKQMKDQEKLIQKMRQNKEDETKIGVELNKLMSLQDKIETILVQQCKPKYDIVEEKKISAQEISENITVVGDQIRKLKSDKADKNIIQEKVQILLELKTSYKATTGQEWKPPAATAANPVGKKENEKKGKKSNTDKVNEKNVSDTVKKEMNMDNVNEILLKIKDVGDKIRQLKSEKADKKVIGEEVAVLLTLKGKYKEITGEEWTPNLNITMKEKESCNKVQQSGNKIEENVNEILIKIKDIGDKIRQLKSEKADKKVIGEEVGVLLTLKGKYKEITGEEWTPNLNITVKGNESCNKVQQSGNKKEDSVNEILIKIKDVGDKIRQLKSQKVDKKVIGEEVAVLLTLKGKYKEITGEEWTPNLNITVKEDESCTKAHHNSNAKSSSNRASPPTEIKQVTEKNVQHLLDVYASYQPDGFEPKYKGLIEESPYFIPPDSLVLGQDIKKSSDVDILTEKIKKQGNLVRQLKSSNTDKEQINKEVQQLLSLKLHYQILTGQDFPTEGKSQSPNKKAKNNDGGASKKPTQQKEKVSKTETKPAQGDSSLKKVTRLGLEAKKEENLPDWYSQIIVKSELIEYYDISGCYILRPWSFAIWETIKDWFDCQIKLLGVKNCYFPIFVSKSVLEKEKTHIADFAPEVAWVTKSGESDLAEPIAIRPTSETVMYPSYAKWIQSYRDLPIKLNQWNNVIRWEFKHPQPFLRTREFLWQEGHTAYATYKEAEEEVYTILNLYASIYTDLLAIPVIKGRKTEKEKFAGGDFTLTVEAYIPASGRAIQGATSHHLGQNFSKMFDIIYEDPDTQEKKYVYQNSWGITTRTIGVLIMVHADNQGLVLPPNVATIQTIVVPCGITATLAESEKNKLLDTCKTVKQLLKSQGIRSDVDLRDNYSPGWKFNHWELKGVPIRVEIGPKDLQKQQIVAVRRDTGDKTTIPLDCVQNKIHNLLENIQSNLLSKATEELTKHVIVCKEWNIFCQELDNKNMLLSPFCGNTECEDKIKEESARNDAEMDSNAPSMGAKSLCIPFEQQSPITDQDKCIHPACNAKPKFYCLFGRSY